MLIEICYSYIISSRYFSVMVLFSILYKVDPAGPNQEYWAASDNIEKGLFFKKRTLKISTPPIQTCF